MKQHRNNVVLNLAIGGESLDSLTQSALSAVDNKTPQVVFACANSHSLAVTTEDDMFFSALENADQLVADGVGVTFIGKLANLNVGPRIAGEDYFYSLMNALYARGQGRVFFFGSSDKVLQLIEARFSKEFPSLEFCGSLSPPYKPWSSEENTQMIDYINIAKPDVLWVGMTAPKQEKWVYQNRASLNSQVIGSIGAVFDYYAETIPSPPAWIRKHGLETFYRFFKEPKRLFYRVIISNGKFFYLAIRSLFSGSHNNPAK